MTCLNTQTPLWIVQKLSRTVVTGWFVLFLLVTVIGAAVRQAWAAELMFGVPRPLTEINDPTSGDFSPSLSPDGLELYFMGYQRPGSGSSDLYVARRDSTLSLYGPSHKLEPPLNTGGADSNPEISADGLTLFFDSSRAGTSGERDIWTVSRPSITDPWGSPVNLGAPVNGFGFDGRPTVSGDGLILAFDRDHDRLANTLFMATRANKEEAFGTPQNLGILGSSPSISADGLMLFFMRFSSNPSDFNIYVTTRATRQDAFGTPMPLGPEINSDLSEADPDISFDGSTLHFVRTDLFRIPGSPEASFLKYADLWEAAVISIPEPTAIHLFVIGCLVGGFLRCSRFASRTVR